MLQRVAIKMVAYLELDMTWVVRGARCRGWWCGGGWGLKGDFASLVSGQEGLCKCRITVVGAQLGWNV
jgi:hypothetical protein